MMEVDRLPPRPEATIEAIRSIGYSFGSAIADIIDNSIAAGATEVSITLHYSGRDSWCAIADDGRGMTESELREAMRIGSWGTDLSRTQTDLGRFGMGLKSAGFSQARRISVISKSVASDVSCRTWDLDDLHEAGDWNALTFASPVAEKFASERISHHGTVVFLERLDGSTKLYQYEDENDTLAEQFLDLAIELENYISRVFGRYLAAEGRLTIRINGSPVKAWLPHVDHIATQEIPTENLMFRGVQIRCRSYVLPHPDLISQDTEESTTSLLSNLTSDQGFYIYRRDRLILGSAWLDRHHNKERETSLARLELDVPPELDRYWELTVDKTRVTSPKALASDIRRIAEVARGRSRAVFRNRGVIVPRRSSGRVTTTPLIQILSRRGMGIARINEEHPMIARLLDSPNRSLIVTAIRTLNESISQLINRDSGDAIADGVEDEMPVAIRQATELLIEHFVSTTKMTRAEIVAILKQTEPMSNYPEEIERMLSIERE
jgi:hypothetical protein